MRRWSSIRVLLCLAGLLGLAALFLSACGDDDSSSPNTKTAAAADSTKPATSAPSSSDGKTTPAASPSAAASGLADLQKATKDLKAIDYRVAYDASMTVPGGTASNASITLAHKGTKSLIIVDGALAGGGDNTGKITIIDDGTSTLLCTEQQKTCLKTKSTPGATANPFLGLADSFKAENLVGNFSKDGYEVKQVANQTIAGRSAKCFEAKGPTGKGTVCVDSKNGMLLLIDGSDTANGQTSKTLFKAKEATDAPSDADFNPPYPVQALPGQ